MSFSVSISAITSPWSTESPDDFDHLATVPSIMKSPSRGMTMDTAIGYTYWRVLNAASTTLSLEGTKRASRGRL